MLQNSVILSMSSKFRRRKKGAKKKLRAGAERCPSPRIVQAKRCATKKSAVAKKRKRASNLRRGTPKQLTGNPKTTAGVPTVTSARPTTLKKHLRSAQDALDDPNISPCKRGKEHSRLIIVIMIRVVSLFVTMQNTVTRACQVTSRLRLLGVSQEAIRKHVMLWYDKQEIRQSTKKRGQGSARYGDNNHVLKHRHLAAISKYVDHNNKRAGGMTGVKQIRNHLFRTFGVRYKRSTLYYALRVRLGYRYDKPTSRSVIITEKRTKRLRKHWLQRDLALKMEARGEAIIVYMDESYVHQNHFPEKCWFHPDRPQVTRPAGKGQRLIIVYAITKDGLLRYCPAGDDKPPCPGEFDSGIYPTSEMIYRAKSARGDYHDQMDCDMFMLWMERRLVPAFEAKYPGKIMVLCLDNAPYHHGRHKDGFWCKEHNKDAIAEKLASIGCRHLRVKLDFTSTSTLANEQPPTVDSPPEDFIGYYLLDTEDDDCYEVTHFAEDDSEYDQGQVVCVTKMAVQRGEKTWFSLDEDRARVHGLRTFQQMVKDGTLKLIGYGDEAYIAISKFWRRHRRAPRREKPDTSELFLNPAELAALTGVDEAPKFHTYAVEKLAERYNGRGGPGTGGPKTEWLRKAGDAWISNNKPELHDTRLMRYCRAHNIKLVFTAPYEFDSQPIENVWRDVKGEVARLYYPRRTITETRVQLVNAFNTRISAEFCAKLILGSENYLNGQIENDPVCSKLGRIGHFVNPPHINPSDESIDFDGVDLVSDEDPDVDDDEDYEDC